MKINFYIFIIAILFFSSCNSTGDIEKTKEVAKDSIVLDDTKYRTKLKVKLNVTASKAVSNWEEYQIITEFIQQYQAISTIGALGNATEISELATHLKDSVIDAKLKTPAFKTRLNILQNECLRLKDMERIPAITTEEVKIKVRDILVAYEAVNAKINSIYQVNDLKNELELDPDFEKILLESTIDTINPPKPIVKKQPNRKKYNKKLVNKKRNRNLLPNKKKNNLIEQK